MQKEKVLLLEKSLQDLNEQLSFAHADCVEKDGILAKQSKVAEEAILGITVLIISVSLLHIFLDHNYFLPTVYHPKSKMGICIYAGNSLFLHSICIANVDTRLGKS